MRVVILLPELLGIHSPRGHSDTSAISVRAFGDRDRNAEMALAQRVYEGVSCVS